MCVCVEGIMNMLFYVFMLKGINVEGRGVYLCLYNVSYF